MKLQVLLSTMNQNNYDLIKKAKIQTSAVVVNQTDTEGHYKVDDDIVWIDTKTRGLSKSRNIALENASEEICLFADDDLEYVDGYESKILKTFEENKEDIICFQVEGIEREFKKYSSETKKIGYLNALKVSSVEIAFRRESIEKNGICFDELFGAGTHIKMGEENIFLYDCLKKGLKIKYVPLKIADLHTGNSSWFTGFNEEYLQNRGAIFYRMSNMFWPFLILQFSIRKRNLFQNIQFTKIIKQQLNGKNNFKKLLKDRDRS